MRTLKGDIPFIYCYKLALVLVGFCKRSLTYYLHVKPKSTWREEHIMKNSSGIVPKVFDPEGHIMKNSSSTNIGEK